tara:strand:- start:14019 stop:14441 length:423 start_codon:yes stop_codon:yes gene_type:complete
MRPFARLFSIFAIIAMVGAPAMACCLTGHAETGAQSALMAQMDSGNCHSEMAGMAMEEPTEAPTDKDCAGCSDCEATFVSLNDGLQPASLSAPHSTDFAATLTTRFAGFDTPRLVQATGPPRNAPVPSATLIELKQILLI